MRPLSPSDFLHKVWPSPLLRNEQVELRAIDRDDNSIERSFHSSIPDFEKAAKCGSDIYFGVSTRRGNNGKKDGCFRSRVVWVDFDNAKLDRVKEIDPAPNIAVESGRGLHLYYLLETPANLMIGPERVMELEGVNRALTVRFGGDIAAIDASRILRVPGHFNHKYSPPREVRAYSTGVKTIYSLEYFRKNNIYLPKPPVDDEELDLTAGDVIRDLPETARRLLRNPGGSSHDGDCSRQDSAAISSMLAAGLKPEDVYATFVHSPRGKDAAERKDGHFEDYVRRTISKASAHIEDSSEGDEESPSGLKLVKMSQVKPCKPTFLIPPYVGQDSVTLFVGDPGTGKSLVILWLIAHLTTRRKILGVTLPPMRVMFLSNEDPGGISSWRFKQAGGNPDLVMMESIDGSMFTLDQVEELEEAIRKYRPRLVVIDSVMSHLGGTVDSYRANQVAAVITPLARIAEKYSLAIIGLMHMNKAQASRILYRVQASIGFTAAARSVMALDFDPDDPDGRILCHIKSNNAALGPSQALTVADGVVAWNGESDLKAGDLFGNELNGEDKRAMNEAEAFLRNILLDAPMPSKEVVQAATEQGISETTLKRAKKKLGIESQKNKDGTWAWMMPEKAGKTAKKGA